MAHERSKAASMVLTSELTEVRFPVGPKVLRKKSLTDHHYNKN